MQTDSISFKNYDYKVVDYLSNLAPFPTQADKDGLTEAALKKFMPCAEYIASVLENIGVEDIELTDEGYIYATIPSTVEKNVPTIAFMAHYDTAMENPGGSEAVIHENYQGGDLELPSGTVTIPAAELQEKVGHDVITGNGKKQLGADDKAGLAAILDTARYLINHSEIPHGKICLIFTNNEEIGLGTAHLDYEKLDADYAYCVDSGEVGTLFMENFNAEAADITITGVSVHPGYAKDKMVNALFIANDLVSTLREKFKAPEDSGEREPYLGLNEIKGTWTKATVHYLLRGFDRSDIEEMQEAIKDEIMRLETKYPKADISLSWDQVHRYQNSAEILDKHPLLNQKAEQAYQAVGVEVIPDLTRGGFDGVRMSFAGLPSTNVFDGAMNMHGLNEWVTRQDLELTVRMLVHLAKLWTG